MIKYSSNDNSSQMIIIALIIALFCSFAVSAVVVAVMDPFGFFKNTDKSTSQQTLISVSSGSSF